MNNHPHAAHARVDGRKVKDYLLNPGNAQNRGKAALFQSFEFARDRWHVLADALREHAKNNPVIQTSRSAHGMKYVVACQLKTPDGRNPCLTSVWIIEANLTYPRLVTAY